MYEDEKATYDKPVGPDPIALISDLEKCLEALTHERNSLQQRLNEITERLHGVLNRPVSTGAGNGRY